VVQLHVALDLCFVQNLVLCPCCWVEQLKHYSNELVLHEVCFESERRNVFEREQAVVDDQVETQRVLVEEDVGALEEVFLLSIV